MKTAEVAYTVSCTFADAEVANQWAQWLIDEHAADVIAGGASAAAVVRYDTGEPTAPVRMEVRYRFPSREAFDRYEREHAPRLREDGLRRFPLSLGLAYSRSVGTVVHDAP